MRELGAIPVFFFLKSKNIAFILASVKGERLGYLRTTTYYIKGNELYV